MSFIFRRLAFFAVTLWAAVTLNFLLPRLMPGNPAQAMMARFHGRLSPTALHTMEIAFGLNSRDSVFLQYWQYLGNTLHGNFGVSYYLFPATVSSQIPLYLPWTVGLVGITTILAFILGTLVGMLSAWLRGGLVDSLLPPVFVVLSALPFFWIGLVLIYVFAISNPWLPTGSTFETGSSIHLSWSFAGEVVRHGILPGFCILITSIGGWILTMRNNMITVLAEDYIKMARAKGISPIRIMFMYAGRNALLPNLTGFAMSLGFVVSGAVLVEIVFNYPGIGYLLVQAVEGSDYPLMQAIFLLITVAVLVAVLLSDAATALLDPRTRVRQ